jgi:hypothetical protein
LTLAQQRRRSYPANPTVCLTIEKVSQASAAQAQSVAAAAGVAALLSGATGVSVHAAAVQSAAALAPAPVSAEAQDVVNAARAAAVRWPTNAQWVWDVAVDSADATQLDADSRRRYNDPAVAHPLRSTHPTSDWARNGLVSLDGPGLAARMLPFRQ